MASAFKPQGNGYALLWTSKQMSRLRSQAHKPRPSTHCQATIKHCEQVAGSKPPQKPNQNRFQSKKKPPTPCKFCTDLGQTNYHWHRECKNRTPSTTPETTNVITADDNTDTPTVTNVSKSAVNVPAVWKLHYHSC